MNRIRNGALVFVLAGCQPAPVPEPFAPVRPISAVERFATSAQFRNAIFYDCTFPADTTEDTLTGRFFLGIESPEFNGETLLCHAGDGSDALECADRTIVDGVNILKSPTQAGEVLVTVQPNGAARRDVYAGAAMESPRLGRHTGTCQRGPTYTD